MTIAMMPAASSAKWLDAVSQLAGPWKMSTPMASGVVPNSAVRPAAVRPVTVPSMVASRRAGSVGR